MKIKAIQFGSTGTIGQSIMFMKGLLTENDLSNNFNPTFYCALFIIRKIYFKII